MALALFILGGCAQEIIAHQQVERDANHILVLLRQAGLDPTKERDADSRDLVFNVLVPRDVAGTALSVLETHNLPKAPRPDTAEMVRSGGSMIPTTEQERAKRIVGVEGDITNALRSLPRVVRVATAVSIPEVDPLRDINEEAPKPKASVIVEYRPDQTNAAPFEPKDVQDFVQAKLPEIRSQNVNVLLLPSQSAVPGANGRANGGAPAIDPSRGCIEKERVLSIEVCRGNKNKVVQLVLFAGIIAALLAALAVVAVLRAMRYRKDLTRLTAQFQRHGVK